MEGALPGRAAVEREFGNLKHQLGLTPLRVRRIARVRLHADLTILARLACVLAAAQAVPWPRRPVTQPSHGGRFGVPRPLKRHRERAEWPHRALATVWLTRNRR